MARESGFRTFMILTRKVSIKRAVVIGSAFRYGEVLKLIFGGVAIVVDAVY